MFSGLCNQVIMVAAIDFINVIEVSKLFYNRIPGLWRLKQFKISFAFFFSGLRWNVKWRTRSSFRTTLCWSWTGSRVKIARSSWWRPCSKTCSRPLTWQRSSWIQSGDAYCSTTFRYSKLSNSKFSWWWNDHNKSRQFVHTFNFLS